MRGEHQHRQANLMSNIKITIGLSTSYGHNELRLSITEGDPFLFKQQLITNKIYYKEDNFIIVIKSFSKIVISKLLAFPKTRFLLTPELKKYMGYVPTIDSEKIFDLYGVSLTSGQQSTIGKILLDYPSFLLNDEDGCRGEESALIASLILGGSLTVKCPLVEVKKWAELSKLLKRPINIKTFNETGTGDILIIDQAHKIGVSRKINNIIKKDVENFSKIIFITPRLVTTQQKVFLHYIQKLLNGRLASLESDTADIGSLCKKINAIDHTYSRQCFYIENSDEGTTPVILKKTSLNLKLKEALFRISGLSSIDTVSSKLRQIEKYMSVLKAEFVNQEIRRIRKQSILNNIAVVSRYEESLDKIKGKVPMSQNPSDLSNDVVFFHLLKKGGAPLVLTNLTHVILMDIGISSIEIKECVNSLHTGETAPVVIYPVVPNSYDEQLIKLPRLSSVISVLKFLKNTDCTKQDGVLQ
jgi:hypothetical protein